MQLPQAPTTGCSVGPASCPLRISQKDTRIVRRLYRMKGAFRLPHAPDGRKRSRETHGGSGRQDRKGAREPQERQRDFAGPRDSRPNRKPPGFAPAERLLHQVATV